VSMCVFVCMSLWVGVLQVCVCVHVCVCTHGFVGELAGGCIPGVCVSMCVCLFA